MIRSRFIGVLGWLGWLGLGLGFVLPAAAHDMWLRPGSATEVTRIEPGDLIPMGLWQGHPDMPEAVNRNTQHLLRFNALGPGGETLSLPGLDGQAPAGFFRPTSAGVWTVVYQGRPVFYSLPAEHFERYLMSEGLEKVVIARLRQDTTETEGRELVSRSLKGLLRVANAPLEDRRVDLPVELVLESYATDQVTLELWVDGHPETGALIDLHRLPSMAESEATESEATESEATEGELYQKRTDARGRAVFDVKPSPHNEPDAAEWSGAEWMAAAVVTESIDSPEAEWHTTFATLTFSAPTFSAPTSSESRGER